MTSIESPFPDVKISYFDLQIHRVLSCIHCASKACERYDDGSGEHHIYCHSCEMHWLDGANEALELLDQEILGFLDVHGTIISKALDSFTSVNSFGKKKINYKKFIPELLEFFEDNCRILEDYEIQKLDLTFSISPEGVDSIDDFLNDLKNDLKDLPN